MQIRTAVCENRQMMSSNSFGEHRIAQIMISKSRIILQTAIWILYTETISGSTSCLQYWIKEQQRCYLLYQNSVAWQQASVNCARMNATLTSISGISEQLFITQLLQDGSVIHSWIGLWRNESTWQWTDASNLTFNKLDVTNTSTEGGCAAISVDGRWFPTACYTDLPYICETEARDLPVKKSTLVVKYPSMPSFAEHTLNGSSSSTATLNKAALEGSSLLTTTSAIGSTILVEPDYEENEEIITQCLRENSESAITCLLNNRVVISDLCDKESTFRKQLSRIAHQDASMLLKITLNVANGLLSTGEDNSSRCNGATVLHTVENFISDNQNLIKVQENTTHYMTEYIEFYSTLVNPEDLEDFTIFGEYGCMVKNISFDTEDRKAVFTLQSIGSGGPMTLLLLVANIAIETVAVENSDNASNYVIVSPIMSLSSYRNYMKISLQHIFTIYHRSEEEVFEFMKREDFNTTTQALLCAYFKPVKRTWSTTGCELVSSGGSLATCSCNHTTSFAVLMKITEFEIPEEQDIALSVITYIGCSVSVVTMFIALTVFTCVRSLNSERVFVHRNLCLAILLSHVTFLAGIRALKHQGVCRGVAFILHYLYTCTFMWMLVEGLHLYTQVVQVFGTEKSRSTYYMFFGWGIPVILVTVSAISSWEGYGTARCCWLSVSRQTIWAFVGPALAIIIVNVVILIMVLKIVIVSAKKERSGMFSHIRAGAKGAMLLLPLLGLSWVFGIMAVNKDLLVFEYLFAVFNSLQGFFIFLLHCACNSEVRQALHRLREKMALQHDHDRTTSFSSDCSRQWPLQGPGMTLRLKAEYIEGVKMYRSIQTEAKDRKRSIDTLGTDTGRKKNASHQTKTSLDSTTDDNYLDTFYI